MRWRAVAVTESLSTRQASAEDDALNGGDAHSRDAQAPAIARAHPGTRETGRMRRRSRFPRPARRRTAATGRRWVADAVVTTGTAIDAVVEEPWVMLTGFPLAGARPRRGGERPHTEGELLSSGTSGGRLRESRSDHGEGLAQISGPNCWVVLRSAGSVPGPRLPSGDPPVIIPGPHLADRRFLRPDRNPADIGILVANIGLIMLLMARQPAGPWVDARTAAESNSAG